MKAATCEKYGPPEVLTIKEVDKPVPKADEMLIKVHASTVNAADCNIRGLTYIPPGLGLLAKLMLGFRKPKKSILGTVFAGGLREMLQMIGTSLAGGKKVKFGGGTGSDTRENMELLKNLIETGNLQPVPDRSFSLEEIAEAHRYVETGRKKGNVIITINTSL
jgi:NADPH:quinone reductase-like Zn-dependent oxidoreductase